MERIETAKAQKYIIPALDFNLWGSGQMITADKHAFLINGFGYLANSPTKIVPFISRR